MMHHIVTTHKEIKELVQASNTLQILILRNLFQVTLLQLCMYLLFLVNHMNKDDLSISHYSSIPALKDTLKLPYLCKSQQVDNLEYILRNQLGYIIHYSNEHSLYFQHNQDLLHKLLLDWFLGCNHQ